MFWKLRDKLASLNLAKLKRDAYIETQRLQYRSRQLKSEIEKEIKRQTPRVKQVWKQMAAYKPHLDTRQFTRAGVRTGLRSADGKWTSLRDKWVDRVDAGGRLLLGLATKLWKWVNLTTAAKTTAALGQRALKDTKDFLSENLRYSKSHIRSYIQANQQFFDYYRQKYWSLAPKSKHRLMLFGSAAGLIYAVGVLAQRQTSVPSRP